MLDRRARGEASWSSEPHELLWIASPAFTGFSNPMQCWRRPSQRCTRVIVGRIARFRRDDDTVDHRHLGYSESAVALADGRSGFFKRNAFRRIGTIGLVRGQRLLSQPVI